MPINQDTSLWATVLADCRRWFYIAWHRLVGVSFDFPTVVTIAVRVGFILLPVILAIKGGYSWLYLVLYLLLLIFVKRQDLSPANLQLVRDGYADRKGWLAAALMIIDSALRNGQPLTKEDRDRIQQYALDIIVSYVRGHRYDMAKTRIYANLLVEQGNELKVLRRDSHCRRTGSASHDKADMVAGRAITEQRVVFTGDVKREYPTTPTGKGYNSVLALPIIISDLDGKLRVVGAVSVDSFLPYHFDTYANDLHTFLLPYLSLIAATLA